MNVLIIDDDRFFGFLAREMLAEHTLVTQFKVETSGQEALLHLHTCQQDGCFPDLVIVECNMPIMDGFTFIEQFEQRFFRQHPRTKLVMCTSSIREEDQMKALRYASVWQFITKPLTEEKLHRLLTESGSTLSGNKPA